MAISIGRCTSSVEANVRFQRTTGLSLLLKPINQRDVLDILLFLWSMTASTRLLRLNTETGEVWGGDGLH